MGNKRETAHGHQAGNRAEQHVLRSQQFADHLSGRLFHINLQTSSASADTHQPDTCILQPPAHKQLFSGCAAGELPCASFHAVPKPVTAHLGHGHPHTGHGACTVPLQEGSGASQTHCLLSTWGLATCTADLQAGGIPHLSGCAPGALPPTTGHSAGLPVAANRYTCMPTCRGLPALHSCLFRRCNAAALHACSCVSMPQSLTLAA